MLPKLSIYTNIPTPYQEDFFHALSLVFDLKVVYYALSESDRQWKPNEKKQDYEVKNLKNTKFALFIQKFYKDFHFSWGILTTIFNDSSKHIIVSGNYYALNSIVAIILSKIRGKKVFFWGERPRVGHSKISKIVKFFSLFHIELFCDGLLCNGKSAIESYTKLGLSTPKYKLTYNIEDSLFSKSNLNQEKLIHLKKSFSKNENDLLLLTSGSLIERKGIDSTILTYKKLLEKGHSNLILLILGDGPLLTSLSDLANSVSENIHFVGFKEKEEIPYYFNICDIFLLCSHYDGWGLVINEALAAGLPVVTNKNVGASEMIENNINGYSLDEEISVDEYAKHLEFIINDGVKLKKMSANNKALSNQVNAYSMANHVKNILVEACK